jgi:hypothetical protein
LEAALIERVKPIPINHKHSYKFLNRPAFSLTILLYKYNCLLIFQQIRKQDADEQEGLKAEIKSLQTQNSITITDKQQSSNVFQCDCDTNNHTRSVVCAVDRLVVSDRICTEQRPESTKKCDSSSCFRWTYTSAVSLVLINNIN